MICPACGGSDTREFHQLTTAPTTDVGLFKNQAKARAVPMAPMAIQGCDACGFAWNSAFNPALVDYHQTYESTQIHSATFRKSLSGLIERLCSELGDGNGTLVEVGCGQGELITDLCQAANRPGIGVDPAYRGPARVGDISFRAETFEASALKADIAMLVCKMTLEHLWQPLDFVRGFAEALGDGKLFIQVPRFDQAVADGAYWDIYYEHCNYFSEASLKALCAAAGLRALDIWTEYEGQYVLGLFTRDTAQSAPQVSDALATYDAFARSIERSIADWRAWLVHCSAQGQKIALWGGGSKAVSFVTHLGEIEPVVAAIDINPEKSGSYLPGSGLPVIMPDQAAQEGISGIILMNPVYRAEVAAHLETLGMGHCPLIDIGEPPSPAG